MSQERETSRSAFAKRARRWLRSPAGVGAAVLVVGAITVSGVSALTDGVVRVIARREAAHPGKVLARVNGEPVYEGDLAAASPMGLLELTAKEMRSAQLQRLIQRTEIRQFLRDHHVSVAQADVEKDLNEMRRNPPSLGCACCRYSSLEEFLDAQGLTVEELRGDLEVKRGLRQYAEQAWQEEQSGSKPKAQRTDLSWVSRDYINGWQIFFNTFQRVGKSGPASTPAEIDRQARAKAAEAWKRLQNGEPFEKVAREMSEDQTSRARGGALGSIRKDSYGKEFAAVVRGLEPGKVSPPFHSPYGYHIIRWEPLSDARQQNAVMKSSYIEAKIAAAEGEIRKQARVETL